MGEFCFNGDSYLEEQAVGKWDERAKKSLTEMLEHRVFECFRLKGVYGSKGNNFGW